MFDTRLAQALDGGALTFPEDGRIAVVQPPQEAQLTAFPTARTHVIERSKPLNDHWRALGFDCDVALDADYAAVFLCLPRAKAQARAMIHDAMMHTAGPVIVDGQKSVGVDSILKEMRRRVELSAPVSKAHGKLFVCSQTTAEAFADWQAGPELTEGGFWTAPGVFSADGIDPASALLADVLPDRLGKTVVDLGAGWGFLSAHVLTRQSVDVCHLVEADHWALECARRNVMDARARFHWADATRWVPDARVDTVVMNPPFHTGRAAEPALGQAFIDAAARMMAPGGALWMVANRHLPYERVLHDAFSNVAEVDGDARFKVFHAARPKRGGRR